MRALSMSDPSRPEGRRLDTTAEADEVVRLREALGNLVDALSDELKYEVSQSQHVLDHIDRACELLGPEYQGYIGEGWM